MTKIKKEEIIKLIEEWRDSHEFDPIAKSWINELIQRVRTYGR